MSCYRDGCESPATHVLRLVVPDCWTDCTAAEGLLDVRLCAYHAATADPRAWTCDPELRAAFRTNAADGTEPDFTEAYLELIPMGGYEHRAYMAVGMKVN